MKSSKFPSFVIIRSTNPYHANQYLRKSSNLLDSQTQMYWNGDYEKDAIKLLFETAESMSDNCFKDESGNIGNYNYCDDDYVLEVGGKSFSYDIWNYQLMTWNEYFKQYRWEGVKALLK